MELFKRGVTDSDKYQHLLENYNVTPSTIKAMKLSLDQVVVAVHQADTLTRKSSKGDALTTQLLRVEDIHDESSMRPLLLLLHGKGLLDKVSDDVEHPRMLCVRRVNGGYKVGVRRVMSFKYPELPTITLNKTTDQLNDVVIFKHKAPVFDYAMRLGSTGGMEILEGNSDGCSYHDTYLRERSLRAVTHGDFDNTTTPEYTINQIGEYITEKSVVWCPCDTIESGYVKVLKALGHTVIHSDVALGYDFLTSEPDEHYDIIVTTPPFSNFNQFIERAVQLDKPFILTSRTQWLGDEGASSIVNDNDIRIKLPTTRVDYENSTVEGIYTTPFQSIFYTRGL